MADASWRSPGTPSTTLPRRGWRSPPVPRTVGTSADRPNGGRRSPAPQGDDGRRARRRCRQPRSTPADDRRAGHRLGSRRRHRVEQPSGFTEVVAERCESGGDRKVWNAQILMAAPDKHDRSPAPGPREQLGGEPTLADPGRTLDQIRGRGRPATASSRHRSRTVSWAVRPTKDCAGRPVAPDTPPVSSAIPAPKLVGSRGGRATYESGPFPVRGLLALRPTNR